MHSQVEVEVDGWFFVVRRWRVLVSLLIISLLMVPALASLTTVAGGGGTEYNIVSLQFPNYLSGRYGIVFAPLNVSDPSLVSLTNVYVVDRLGQPYYSYLFSTYPPVVAFFDPSVQVRKTYSVFYGGSNPYPTYTTTSVFAVFDDFDSLEPGMWIVTGSASTSGSVIRLADAKIVLNTSYESPLISSWLVLASGSRALEIEVTNPLNYSVTAFIHLVINSSNFHDWQNVRDGTDVFFVDSKGRPLRYWIPYINKSAPLLITWVQAHLNPGTNKIYMLYGGHNPHTTYAGPTAVTHTNTTTITTSIVTVEPGDIIAPHLYDWWSDGDDDYVMFDYGLGGYLTQYFRNEGEGVTFYAEVYLAPQRPYEKNKWPKLMLLVTNHWFSFWMDLRTGGGKVYIGGIGYLTRYNPDGTVPEGTWNLGVSPWVDVYKWSWGFCKMAVKYDRETNVLTKFGYLYVPNRNYEYYGENSHDDTDVYNPFNYPDDTNPLSRGEYSDVIFVPYPLGLRAWYARVPYVLATKYYDNEPSHQRPVVVSNALFLLDPTFFNGTHFIDLVTGVGGTPYGGVSRVESLVKWLWLVKQVYGDGRVHLRFFPNGSVVTFVNASSGSVVKEVTVVGTPNKAGLIEDYPIDLPPGKYIVKAEIPKQAVIKKTIQTTTEIQPNTIIAPHLHNWYFNGQSGYVSLGRYDPGTSWYIESRIMLFPHGTDSVKDYQTIITNLRGVWAGNRLLVKDDVILHQIKGVDGVTYNHIILKSIVNEWHIVAAELKDNKSTIWIDDISQGSVNVNTPASGTHEVDIGGFAEARVYYAIGYISYVVLKTSKQGTYKLVLDPTFFNGTHYINLVDESIVGIPYGGVSRVVADEFWLWVVNGSGVVSDGRVHLRFFPVGSIVRFYDNSTGDLVAEFVVGGEGNDAGLVEDFPVSLPAGAYRVVAEVPVYELGKSVSITVKNNVNENLTNYAVRVVLNSDNFLGWDDVRPDGSDIYFTLPNGTALYYFKAYFNYTAKNAVFYVRVPYIPALGTATIIMWYGGNNPYPLNDGGQVFTKFWDFTSLTDWTVLTGTWAVGNTTTNGYLYVVTSYDTAPGNVIYSNYYWDAGTSGNITVGMGFYMGYMGSDAAVVIVYNTSSKELEEYCQKVDHTDHAVFNGTAWNITHFYGGFPQPSGSFGLVEVYLPHGMYYRVIDGRSFTDEPFYPEGYLGVKAGVNSNTRFDYFFIREYVDPEPSVSFGSPVSYVNVTYVNASWAGGDVYVFRFSVSGDSGGVSVRLVRGSSSTRYFVGFLGNVTVGAVVDWWGRKVNVTVGGSVIGSLPLTFDDVVVSVFVSPFRLFVEVTDVASGSCEWFVGSGVGVDVSEAVVVAEVGTGTAGWFAVAGNYSSWSVKSFRLNPYFEGALAATEEEFGLMSDVNVTVRLRFNASEGNLVFEVVNATSGTIIANETVLNALYAPAVLMIGAEDVPPNTYYFAFVVWVEPGSNTTRYVTKVIEVPEVALNATYVPYASVEKGSIQIERFTLTYGETMYLIARGDALMRVVGPVPIESLTKFVVFDRPYTIEYAEGKLLLYPSTAGKGLTLKGFRGYRLTVAAYGSSVSDVLIPSDEYEIDIPLGFSAIVVVDPSSRQVSIVATANVPPAGTVTAPKLTPIQAPSVAPPLTLPNPTTSLDDAVLTTILIGTFAAIAIAVARMQGDVGAGLIIAGTVASIMMIALRHYAPATTAAIAVAVGIAIRVAKR